MQHIEALPKLDELFVIVKIAAATAPTNVMCVRRARHHAEMNVIAANRQCASGVCRGQPERGRRGCDCCHDQPAICAHDHRAVINLRPGRAKIITRLGAHHLDSIFFQQPQGCLVNRFNLVGAKRGQRGHVVLHILPVGLQKGSRIRTGRITAATATTSPARRPTRNATRHII